MGAPVQPATARAAPAAARGRPAGPSDPDQTRETASEETMQRPGRLNPRPSRHLFAHQWGWRACPDTPVLSHHCPAGGRHLGRAAVCLAPAVAATLICVAARTGPPILVRAVM